MENNQVATKKWVREIAEWVKAIAIAALLVFVLKTFLFAPFIVDGPSMQPNFYTGERVFVNQLIYDLREPKRGEVVVFHVPSEGRDFIKRVIAIPGDTITYVGDTLTINGKQVNEQYLSSSIKKAMEQGELFNTGANFPNDEFTTNVVPEGHFLAFGDNRRDSMDSRMIGFIPNKNIIGRADVIFWPINQLKFVNHDVE